MLTAAPPPPGAVVRGGMEELVGEKQRRRSRTGTSMNQHMDIVPQAKANAGTPLDNDMQAHIGRQLRAMYDTVVNQPVPDRFVELLNQLDAKTGDEKEPE